MGVSITGIVKKREFTIMASSLKQLGSISPTTFTKAKQCALNALWSLNGSPPLLPTSPVARVGTIAHRLLSEAGQGRLPVGEGRIGARWEELTERVHSEMRTSTIERHLVPLSNSVPDMAVRRIRAVQRALDIATSRGRSQPERQGTRPRSGYGHELPVESSDGTVKGRIDAVVRTSKGPAIQDYKTGRISQDDGNGEVEVSVDYQVQLKLYAALYAESFGEWPDSIALVHLSGSTYEVDFSIAECTRLLSEASATLQRLNTVIGTDSGKSTPSVLASPGPDVCAYCQYRPACEPYQSARREAGSIEWPKDVIGTLISANRLGNGKLMLRVMTDSGLVNVPGVTDGSRHTTLPTIKLNDRIGVFALRRTRSTGHLLESHLTTIYKLPVSYTIPV